jgi:hypothetical protein
MDDENRENLGNLPGILAGIRETELPGRRGGVSHYARTVYACFAEIQNLTAEGFTLSTICKFLERKGVLPQGADTRGFCRAYRREVARRERPVRSKRAKAKEVSVRNDNAAKLTEATGARREPAMTGKQTPPPLEPKGGLRLNPDNTFKIEPIDFDGLPDFKNLTKRRNEE